jgi:hypothetical protein
MPISLNVTFSGTVADDPEHAHPPGACLARQLRTALSADGWNVSEMDNWRDCGWQLDCSEGESQLQTVLAATAESDHWMLQIAPLRSPGFLARLLGAKPSAGPDAVYMLARSVHASLVRVQQFSSVLWCWDGFPGGNDSTPEPPQPDSPPGR